MIRRAHQNPHKLLCLSCRFATGSVDTTIKLWTPFSTTSSSKGGGGADSSSSSSRPGVSIRPCRTLTGHTDGITALTCLLSLCHSMHSRDETSSGGCSSAGVPILVSGSADKTIKLWSLASIQRSSPSGTAAAAAAFTTSSAASSSGGGSGSSSGDSRGHAVRRGGQQKQQQARNPLLGTLRGHSGAVCSLLPWPPAGKNADDSCHSNCQNTAPPAGRQGRVSGGSNGSSGGSSGSLLSGSRDSRVKLWDVCEDRQSCVATWRLPGSCRQLLGGLGMAGCVVVMLDRSLQVGRRGVVEGSQLAHCVAFD